MASVTWLEATPGGGRVAYVNMGDAVCIGFSAEARIEAEWRRPIGVRLIHYDSIDEWLTALRLRLAALRRRTDAFEARVIRNSPFSG